MREIKIYSINTLTNIPSILYWLLLGILVLGVIVISYNAIRFNQPPTTNCSMLTANRFGRYLARLMLVEWGFLIFCSALFLREARTVREVNLIPLWSYFDYAENSYLWEMTVINMLNVCMFLPVGLFLKFGFQGATWKRALVVGLVLSVIIELLQFVFRRGLCEVDDVIHNVVGCMIGYGIATFFGRSSARYDTIV